MQIRGKISKFCRASSAYASCAVNRTWGLSSAVIALIVLSFTTCSKYGSDRRVFVTNERGGTITVIEAATDMVIDTIQTGLRPRGARVSRDGKHLYVAVSSPINAPQRAEENYIAVF